MCAFAAAAVLLAAAPAGAQDSAGVVPSATTTDTPTAPTNSTQSNTVTNTQTATATGGAGGSATGGNAGPSQEAGGVSRGGDAYANGGSAEAHNSVENEQSDSTSATNSGGDAIDQVVAVKERKSQRTAGKAHRTRSAARPRSGAATGVTKRGAGRSHGHRNAKRSPGGAAPGRGGLPPEQQQHPFFSLLSASGGAGAGLTLLVLAVLGAAIALRREDFEAFRMPALRWRPPAYVPPIELPG